MPDNRIQLIIEGYNKSKAAFDELGNSIKGIGDSTARTSRTSSSMLDNLRKNWLAITAALGAAYIAYRKIEAVVSSSLRYLSTLETASLGIASSLMTQGKYIDQVTGKALEGQEALQAAQQTARGIMKELQVANMQTIATLDQLVRAYQETLPVAMARGFNLSQVKEFTVGVVQAAGALGIQLDMLAEETRSLLTGTITPRTSRVAVALGLTNEDIRQNSKNADELFNFLMGRLAAFRTAGIESQQTWAGLWSNFKDIALQIGGQVFQPLFEMIKYELAEITSNIISIDEKTKTIKWNPEFLKTIKSAREELANFLAALYKADMFLARIAEGAMIIYATYGWTKGTREKAREEMESQRRTIESRERWLQTEAMRQEGYKRVRGEEESAFLTYKRAGEIAPKSKYYQRLLKSGKYKDYLRVETPGGQEMGFRRIPEGEGAKYEPSGGRIPEDEEAKKQAEKRRKARMDEIQDEMQAKIDRQRQSLELTKKGYDLEEAEAKRKYKTGMNSEAEYIAEKQRLEAAALTETIATLEKEKVAIIAAYEERKKLAKPDEQKKLIREQKEEFIRIENEIQKTKIGLQIQEKQADIDIFEHKKKLT